MRTITLLNIKTKLTPSFPPGTTLLRLGNPPPIADAFYKTDLHNLTSSPLTGSHTKYVLSKGRASRMMKMLQVRGFAPVAGDITLHVMTSLSLSLSLFSSQLFRNSKLPAAVTTT